jgi:ribosomal protein S12 methylthiotransferase
VDHIIPLMAEGKLLPYLDIPFQHASPAVLKAMKRPAHQEKTLARLQRWRAICPELTLRSTFIVGFPGETEADFQYLLDWLEEAQLDRVGCFRYEPVKGAPANDLAAPVPEPVKDQRWHRLMQTQQAISRQKLADKVGSTLDVIVDEVSAEGASGRSQGDAPEIDGTVLITNGQQLTPGDIVAVHVDQADDYDLTGRLAPGTLA